jgi:hypothetical protein
VWWFVDGQVVETHQSGHVDHPVVHLAAFGPPRDRFQQCFEQVVTILQPVGPDVYEGAVAELSALVVLEQRALHRDRHDPDSIAHSFDRVVGDAPSGGCAATV